MRRAIWLLALLLLLPACSPTRGGLRLAGSTSVQPLAEVLAEEYARAGGMHIDIQGGGSTAGVQAVVNGVADIGAISRPLTPEEARRGLMAHMIAYDVLAIIVHPSHPLTTLSTAQVRRIFSGHVHNWAEMGGRSEPIYLFVREAGSGSREAFGELVGPASQGAIVLGSSGAIRAAVAGNPGAIGYVSWGAARQGGVKWLAVDQLHPDEKGYRLTRPLSLVTVGRPSEAVQAFIRFVHSPVGARLILEEGLVPVGAAAK